MLTNCSKISNWLKQSFWLTNADESDKCCRENQVSALIIHDAATGTGMYVCAAEMVVAGLYIVADVYQSTKL